MSIRANSEVVEYPQSSVNVEDPLVVPLRVSNNIRATDCLPTSLYFFLALSRNGGT